MERPHHLHYTNIDHKDQHRHSQPQVTKTSFIERDPEWQRKLFHALRELQAALRRQQQVDPDLSQHQIFRFCTPPFVFLCSFAAGVIVPRHPTLWDRITGVGERTEGPVLQVFVGLLVISAVIVASLIVLRGMIWILARLAQSFCEMDLTALEPKKGHVDEFNISQANLIVGGIFSVVV